MTLGNGSRTSPEKEKPKLGQHSPFDTGTKFLTEDCIDNVVGLVERLREVLGEGNLEVLELFRKTLQRSQSWDLEVDWEAGLLGRGLSCSVWGSTLLAGSRSGRGVWQQRVHRPLYMRKR